MNVIVVLTFEWGRGGGIAARIRYRGRTQMDNGISHFNGGRWGGYDICTENG